MPGGRVASRDAGAASSLPATIPIAQHLAQRGGASQHPEVRVAAATLAAALTDLAQLVDQQFLHGGGDTSQVLASYAAAHGHGRSS
ncbi:hypothetical protein [Modestobacter altitudinis]|uniref:hypothetical protein n=1 Tax=Modestobacter altitudinis TaxID=2213158 RepID=UPI00110D1D64|nr:hypothetical protein [Modestobacter altitudinis]